MYARARVATLAVIMAGVCGCTNGPPASVPDDDDEVVGPPPPPPLSPYDETVTILRNTGEGSFELVVEGSEETGPRCMATADLNDDGLPDLVTGNLYGGSVSVFLNTGDGRLLPAEEYSVGENPTFVTIDDLDGDGTLDMAVANAFSDMVSVLSNRSDGTFEEAVNYDVSGTPTFVMAVDLDQDGLLDLITANPVAGTISVLDNTGGGIFERVEDAGIGRFVNAVVVDDLDGDGVLDVVTSSVFHRTLTVALVGTGSLTFNNVGVWPVALESADFDGDGSTDLATANALDDSVSVLLNDGAGGFGEEGSFAPDYATGKYPNALVVADFNGDGVPDLATSNFDGGTVSVLLNKGDGTFEAAANTSVGRSPNGLSPADMNGDGELDLVTPNLGSDTVTVLFNDGNGGFGRTVDSAAGTAPRAVEVADVDGDGRLDLLVTGHMPPELPPSPSSANGAGTLRTSVPAPRIWQPEYVRENYLRVGGLDGLICLPEQMEWWAATGGSFHSAVFRDQQWQKALARETGATFFIQLDPYPPPRHGPLATRLPATLADQTFASQGVRDAYQTEALERVRWYNPKYVCLAMEINAYFEEQPDDFENFLSLFIETRDLIKEINPDTLVFVSFQYEQLLGRFGAEAGLPFHEPHWLLVEMFEPYQDAVAISSYPLLTLAPQRFSDPSLVPSDYYSRIMEYTDRPIVFAELGWSPDDQFNSSQENQARFLRRFSEELTQGMDVLLVDYFFLSDTAGFGPFFNSLGLIDREGQPKEAFDVWNSMWVDN